MTRTNAEPVGYSKDKAKNALSKYDIDVLVASTPENLFYTSGLPTLHVAPNPILYVLSNQFPTLTLTNSEGDQNLIHWMTYQSCDEFSWIKDRMGIISPKTALISLKDKLEQWGYSEKKFKIGLEELMPRYQYEFIKEKFPNAEIIDADEVFLEMRLIKSEEEIARIKKSTEITDNTIEKLINESKIGMSDNDLLKIARNSVIQQGAEGWDHFTIGLGDSDPEAPGTGRKIAKDEINRYDIGTVYKGYVSDISRNLIIGKVPDGALEVMERIKQVHDFCVDSIKPGINAKQFRNSVKKYVKSLSKIARIYVTVHSIGLQCEELHLSSPMKSSNRDFEENMVIDIEVWQMFTGTGLVGVEDCYVVRNNGVERLSRLKRDFFIKNI